MSIPFVILAVFFLVAFIVFMAERFPVTISVPDIPPEAAGYALTFADYALRFGIAVVCLLAIFAIVKVGEQGRKEAGNFPFLAVVMCMGAFFLALFAVEFLSPKSLAWMQATSGF